MSTSLFEAPTATAASARRARRIAVRAEEPALGLTWVAALEAEGLQVAVRPIDDGAPVLADAIVLHIVSRLAEQLGRLRSLREQAPQLPLLVALRDMRDLDHVLALEMGADDAFDALQPAPVVAARLRALWRRATLQAPAEAARELRFGALELLRMTRQARLADRVVPLTEGEFEVLWLLASHAGQAVSRREILRRVRGLDDHPLDRSIDSRVYRIRAKLGDGGSAMPRIRTVRNHGYAFSPSDW